ncbi:ubiquitinyl hydrolase [Saitoella complicata NRRL Y-17804]|uniref:ubiquitinyl hydrolase n=1 Tax=Saitoella complicata (strain BCRC 22490 / CBS 7301 / JCM 7358 / NBRC 10748 / NRRL Y-17804) TaxID=698492 RepID=UPI00086762D8|nr:ubiquitinyl hydrolase [Saitoella complicata NRRL Y-17804]ODQ50137.1 ubiquitinyl hydrolase [Saitoella complicata NRRL Y-17804]
MDVTMLEATTRCPHVLTHALHTPGAFQTVHREECTLCFDSQDDAEGIDVCLDCFASGCVGERNHAAIHHQRTQHPLYLNIRRTPKPKPSRDGEGEPPSKISKLAIPAESDATNYDLHTSVRCYACEGREVDMAQGNLPLVVDGVMSSMDVSQKNEVKAWEMELTPCEHTLCLNQQPVTAAHQITQCNNCDLKENLWMCLECGNLGCGRSQFGSTVGGNGHGVAHFEGTMHPVSVKLGSLTAEGTADIYCYLCNEERVDLELKAHLAHWGINIAEAVKTEKSLTEMQLEQNLKWEFSMTTSDGHSLQPLFGPSLTGLKNLGNSCYINSTLQCLFNIPAFQERYLPGFKQHPYECPKQDSGECMDCQMGKVADGLLSGRYSVLWKPEIKGADEDQQQEVPHQKGLAPGMLKALVGKGHEEFSTMRQQDAFEFFLHLMKLVARSQHPANTTDPTSAFRFELEQRLECLSCHRVRYRTDEQDNLSLAVPVRQIPSEDGADPKFEAVTLEECLDIFTADEMIEYTCKACGGKDGAKKSVGFKTFPEVLVVNARRFEVVNWVPMKRDVPVIVSDAAFSLDKYAAKGQQPDETLLPEDSEEEKAKKERPVANEAALSQLEAMGFPRVRSEKALFATGNSDPEVAMNWLFAHMDDPDIDDPIADDDAAAGGAGAGAGAEVDEASVAMIVDMGFSVAQGKKALKETGGDMERAVEWLFSHPDDVGEVESSTSSSAPADSNKVPAGREGPASFKLDGICCHKGASIHAGHYIALAKKKVQGDAGEEEAWVLFNDEKVVRAGEENVQEGKRFAYVYFFRRA